MDILGILNPDPHGHFRDLGSGSKKNLMQIRNTAMIICTTEIRKNINTAVPVVQFPDLRDYRKPGGRG